MSVARPALLYVLLALPLFALAFFVRFRRLSPLLQRMSLQKGAFLKTRYGYSGLFGLLTLAALVIAASGPSFTVKHREERARGRDIVLAFDVSRSMNVRDVAHNGDVITRLEGAKIIANGFLTALRGQQTDYRYAAAVGKGEGVLAIPLTYRAETVQAMIDALSSEVISAVGTDVEKLTRAAIGAFPPDLAARYPAEKSVIVFTDGEALSGLFQDAVEQAQEARITVNAVCIGSEQGGPVPVGISEQGTPLFLQDENGKNIVSRAEPGALRETLEQGGHDGQDGGLFFRVDDAGGTGGNNIDTVLASLCEAFLPRERGGQGDEHGGETGGETEMRETEWQQDARFIFAALALVFFALHKGAFYTRAPGPAPKSGPRKKRLLAAAPVLLVFLSCAPAHFAAVEAKFRLLEGNFFVTRAMLSEAEASYIRSRSRAAPGDIPYALYALGLARLLSENEAPHEEKEETDSAAIALFDEAHALITPDAADAPTGEDTAGFRHGHGGRHRELAFRLHYNAGIAHYRAGNAGEAAREFREALLIEPGRIEAKRNLELSLLLLESKNALQTSEVKSVSPVREGASRENTVLFDFIRQKEVGRWQSWAWQGGESDSSLDY